MKAKNIRILALVTVLLATLASKADVFTNVGSMNIQRAYQMATLLQSGKVLVVGNDNTAELYDPTIGTWAFTSSRSHAGGLDTATMLPTGEVMLTGGGDGNGGTSNGTELYDPASGNWHAGASMTYARESHTATLLQSGKILVASGAAPGGWVYISEEYDSTTGTWATKGAVQTARAYHTATLLQNGMVIIAGGTDSNGVALASAEIYNPATGMWTNTAPMGNARNGHTATLLPNGQVLVAGGATNGQPSAELYDPVAGTWTATQPMNAWRNNASASLLANGKVLVAAGGGNSGFLNSAELYDPVAGTWTATSSLNTARASHTATMLASGQVLFAGGEGLPSWLSSAEIYDPTINPATGLWSTNAPLNFARAYHTATLLPNGKVLVAGGSITNAEIFDPASQTWTVTGALSNELTYHSATLLPNGLVLIAGGTTNGSSGSSGAELYDPASGTWSDAGTMITPRFAHTATLLQNGKVLMAAGSTNLLSSNAIIAASELYDPITGTWSKTGAMNIPRSGHTATLLPNGKVLAIGGINLTNKGNTSWLASSELYDPITGTWTLTGNMNYSRVNFTATLLPNGLVLAAGGFDNLFRAVGPAELYNPASGKWSVTGTLTSPRNHHCAVLCPGGKVLITGGDGVTYPYPLISCEQYDPETGMWAATGKLSLARLAHTTTLLPDGQLLTVGGYNDSTGPVGVYSETELFSSGLVFSNAWQPQIATITSTINIGGNLTLTGSEFSGISGGSSGNSQDSSASYPLVQLQSLESGRTIFLLTTNWSANSFVSVPVTNFPPGYALATVFVNGIPSTSSVVNISVPVPTSPLVSSALVSNSFQLSFTNVPGGLFGVWAATNATQALTNWTPLGGATEISPGQYQFTDTNGLTDGQQFYSVRAP